MWHAAAALPTATVAPAAVASSAAAAPSVAVQSGRSGPFCPPSHDAFAHRETIAVHAICRGAVRGVVVQCCCLLSVPQQAPSYPATYLGWQRNASGTRWGTRTTRTRVSHRSDRKWICINIDSLT